MDHTGVRIRPGDVIRTRTVVERTSSQDVVGTHEAEVPVGEVRLHRRAERILPLPRDLQTEQAAHGERRGA